ncbi:MAG: hypothetical protein ACFFCS_24680 [Candidatus Hodarchaeota archaeon]
MGKLSTVHKILLACLIGGVSPLLATNLIMPRIGLVTGDASIDGLADLTVAQYQDLKWQGSITDWEVIGNQSYAVINTTSYQPVSLNEYEKYPVGTYVYYYNSTIPAFNKLTTATNIDRNATLDFWLRVGLPVKDETSEVEASDGTRYDPRWYDYIENETYPMDRSTWEVNVDNLNDSSMEIIIPRLGLEAKFRGTTVGIGGTPKQYVLNKDHPVEYVHLYLTGSREADGGLMYLFNTITQEGVLDSLLLGALGGGGDFDVGTLLADLSLVITAYVGGAPLSLEVDSSLLGLSALPAVMNPQSSIEPSLAGNWMDDINYDINYYNFSANIDDMDRFTGQLGIDDIEPMLGKIGLYDEVLYSDTLGYNADAIMAAINMLFDNASINDPNYVYNLETTGEYYLGGNTSIADNVRLLTEEFYDSATLGALVDPEITGLDTLHGMNLDSTTVSNFISNLDANGLLEYVISQANGSQLIIDDIHDTLDGNTTSYFYKFARLDRLLLEGFTGDIGYGCLAAMLGTYPMFDFNNTHATTNGSYSIEYESNIVNLFTVVFPANGYTIGDMFSAINQTVPSILTSLLFSDPPSIKQINGQNYGLELNDDAIAPDIANIEAESLLLLSSIAAFILLFVLMAITKGRIKINRREFLSRSDIQEGISQFVKRVENLGGKVSIRNAESLSIRAFRTKGIIEKPADIEKRAKFYVENQKLLVTLQSRASRAYVAQKFKDCVAAIEKMIEIARSLEDETLVVNYEENLAKVVRLLRRKGISVKTKIRLEGEKEADSMEKLNLYKKDLVDLQNKSSKAFAEKNFAMAKGYIKEMLVIARKIQDPVLIRNYEANLRKIIQLEKGQ